MADDGGIISSTGFIWSGLLTAVLGYMGYQSRRRDNNIDNNTKATTALELKIAENYATKETVRTLFTETSRTNTENNARIEKRIDETNTNITRLGDQTNVKIDKVTDAIGTMKDTIMKELAKKT